MAKPNSENVERTYLLAEITEMRRCVNMLDTEGGHMEADAILIRVIRWMAEVNGGDFNPVTCLLTEIADNFVDLPKRYA